MTLRFRNLFFLKKSSFSQEKQLSQEEHQKRFIWVYYTNMILGLWLITAPPTFGYKLSVAIWNDIICGILLLSLSIFSLNPYKIWAQWGSIFLGFWLFFAPLLFSVKEGAAYLNDTIIATLIITFGIIIPGQPGIKLFAVPGSNIPNGWSYNPSSWMERIPVITLAWIGFFVSRYLAAFQLGYIDTVWDPFFNDGTREVLTSQLSKSFPVSDAALGAVSYILDVLMGAVGSVYRWRTMPWIVIIFGILIVPLGVVSITLVILQPLIVGHWCTFCLTSAFVSTVMISFTLDEVLASIQLLKYEKKKGTPFWTAFWFGGTIEGGVQERDDPAFLLERTGKTAIKDLISKPWNLFVSIGIGVWIMVSPAILGFSQNLSNSNHFIGALIIAFSIIAMSEVARITRFINIPSGLWVIASPWIFGINDAIIIRASVITGAILISLAIPKGKVADKRGHYDKFIV